MRTRETMRPALNEQVFEAVRRLSTDNLSDAASKQILADAIEELADKFRQLIAYIEDDGSGVGASRGVNLR